MPPDPRGPVRLTGPRSLVGRVIGALVTLAVLVVGLMFSAVLFGVALVLGLLVWGWLWWKMRKVMRQMRRDPRFQQFQDAASRASATDEAGGRIIEGEVLHEEWKDGRGRRD